MTSITTFTSVLVNKLQNSPRERFDFLLDSNYEVFEQPLKYSPFMRSRFMGYIVLSSPLSSLGRIMVGLQSLNT